MIRLLENKLNATHRFKRKGVWLYLLADSVIEVAHVCVLDVKEVEVKNGDKWERAS